MKREAELGAEAMKAPKD